MVGQWANVENGQGTMAAAQLPVGCILHGDIGEVAGVANGRCHIIPPCQKGTNGRSQHIATAMRVRRGDCGRAEVSKLSAIKKDIHHFIALSSAFDKNI